MEFTYKLEKLTKNYAKFEPKVGQPVTGGFYLGLDEFEAAGSPEQITLSVNVLVGV